MLSVQRAVLIQLGRSVPNPKKPKAYVGLRMAGDGPGLGVEMDRFFMLAISLPSKDIVSRFTQTVCRVNASKFPRQKGAAWLILSIH
jgi:hypothetical protein